MILNWPFFLIAQSVVFITYFLLKNNKENFILSKLFSSKIHFVILNASVFISCYWYNSSTQLFCNPVSWAAVLIILFCVSFLFFPFIQKQKALLGIVAVFCGFGVFLSVYLLLFARYEYLIFAALNLPFIFAFHYLLKFIKRKYKTNIFDAFYFYPAVVLMPFLLIYQLWAYFKNLQSLQLKLFVATPVVILGILVLLTVRINNIVGEIKNSQDIEKELITLTSNNLDSYLTELVLGAHWKYHTQLYLVDGWRPPYHDPVLVSANKILHPFSKFNQGVDLQDAKRLYKKTFPNNKTEFDCKCAKHQILFY